MNHRTPEELKAHYHKLLNPVHTPSKWEVFTEKVIMPVFHSILIAVFLFSLYYTLFSNH